MNFYQVERAWSKAWHGVGECKGYSGDRGNACAKANHCESTVIKIVQEHARNLAQDSVKGVLCHK